MASTNKTTNYQLSQFQSSDIPAWLTDYNGDMQKIDAGIHAAKEQAAGAASGVSALQTAVSGKQDTLTFDTTPLSGSNNPVTSGGIYNALQSATVQTDAVPTAGSTKPVQSGGVYTALQGKQNSLVFDSTPTEGSNNPVSSGGVYGITRPSNPFGNFKVQITSTQTREDVDFRYFYNPVSRMFIGYPDEHQETVAGSKWTVASDAAFPSVQQLDFIEGNPFSLTPNSSFPVTQAQMLDVTGVNIGLARIKNANSEDSFCFIHMAYFVDTNRTVIYAQANFPSTSNQSFPVDYMADCGHET